MPESYIIFTGRPNAGKSSIIRAITGLKIATGKRPGTTTKINKYEIAQDLFLVDMPGYGIKVDAPRSWRDKTKDDILGFIEENSEQIIAAVHVLNINTFIETEQRLSNKGFISIDIEMIQYIREYIGEYPFVAANKIDKSSDKEVMENLDALLDSLTDGEPEQAAEYVFPTSAKKGVGVGELKNQLVMKMQKKGYSNPFEFIR